MDIQSVIPSGDPIPFPAPYWLFKLLLVITFVLHLLAMNTMFGGAVLAAVAKIKSKTDENYKRMFSDVSKKIPSFLAAAVTLGVAPLLFLQVIYGQYFYTSSAIIGCPWFLVVPMLIIAYYGFYIAAFKSEKNFKLAGSFIMLSVFLIFLIGFFYSNNMTLMISPEVWKAKYLNDPSGLNLNWEETTLIPRYLHFLVASLAVGGLFVAFIGAFKWKKDELYAKFLIRTGGKYFIFATLVQIAVGIVFLVLLPKQQMMLFMGGNLIAIIGLLAGLLIAIAVIFLMSSAMKQADPRRGLYKTTALIVVVITFMAIMRDILRDSYLEKYFNSADFAISTQWDVLILFLVLFLGGVGLWLLMFKKYFRVGNV